MRMKHCLVVDNIDVVRKVTRGIVGKLQFASSSTDSGEDAVVRCLDEMPDAIFVDSSLTDVAGRDLIARIRHQKGGDEPYIFYCVSAHDVDDIEKAFMAGADGYLVKPFARQDVEAQFRDAGLF